MIRSFLPQGTISSPRLAAIASRQNGFRRIVWTCAAAAMLAAVSAPAQVITIDTHGNATTGNGANVDRRFAQVTPTQVPLTQSVLDAKTRLDLIRTLEAEQGFAMRPFPRGHKGLTLEANGKLEPAGEQYLSMVTSEGLSAKPGDRLVLTDIKIDRSKIVFDLNGGPDARHRFLRHVQIGTGPEMNPVVQADGQEPVGARLTLTFKDHVPELTGKEVKSLLAPLISFDVKTPIQAFTDTLPAQLKEAILSHHVLVGMSTDMVLFAKGQPEKKTREMDGQTPFEEWIYGRPPQDVEFVRLNGNRVIRVEIAKIGEPVAIFTKDVVQGMMRTDGTPLNPADSQTARAAQMGDVDRNPDTQAPAAPPSLRNPGEQLPEDAHTGVMKPVQFPKEKPDTQPGASPNSPSSTSPSSTQTPPASVPAAGQSSSEDTSQVPPPKPAPDDSQPH